ncbi:DUF262 domain-containing protein [Acinetobacter sp. BSP-28]|uniref:GmrSD restriction endonuclease domain-containing protein n=1 Tax=Acinetobacter sp. BSP-28 TaxID=3344661 RepID=UPI00376F92EA
MSNISSKDLKLTSVIQDIYDGDYKLPEFQRDYVWKDQNIKSLFESVLLGHPIGSLLILELNKENPLFAWSNFHEIFPEDPEKLPKFLVLDGQQRLTSLSKLTNGTSRHIWYLDLKKIKESWVNEGMPKDDFAIRKWIDTSIDIVSALTKLKKQDDILKGLRGKSSRLMPLNILKNKTIFSNEINAVRDQIKEEIIEQQTLIKYHSKLNVQESIEQLEKEIVVNNEWVDFLSAPLMRIFDNYYDYNVPCVLISEKMGITGICKVFTKMNTTGVRLGAFDLLVATMYPKKIPIKQMFDEVMENYDLIRVVDQNNKRYLLQTIALFEGVSPKTVSLPEVITKSHIENTWSKACQALNNICVLLDEYCGSCISIGKDTWLVYSPLLAPVAVILEEFPIIDKTNSLKLLRKQKLQAWYFGAGLTQRYGEGSDAKQNQDLRDMRIWFDSPTFNDGMPLWLKEVSVDFSEAYKNGALGKTIVSMLNLKQPKDFYDVDRVVGANAKYSCDLHHIFPKAALRNKIMQEKGIRNKDEADKILKRDYQVDSIFNQTWILSDTNRDIIKDRLPSEYLKDIMSFFGGGDHARQKLLNILEGHVISEKAFDCLMRDDYLSFLDERKLSFKFEFKTTGSVHNLV